MFCGGRESVVRRSAKCFCTCRIMFCGVPHNLFGRSVFYGCTLLKMFLDDKESIERHKRFYWQAMVIYSKLERFTDLIKKICYYSYWIEKEKSWIMSNFYCIWVRTGFEKQFIEKVQAVFDSFPEENNGKLYCVGKQMRLKSGKELFYP